MLELPRAVWRRLSEDSKDLGRIASALETLAWEVTEIRKAIQDDDEEDQR